MALDCLILKAKAIGLLYKIHDAFISINHKNLNGVKNKTTNNIELQDHLGPWLRQAIKLVAPQQFELVASHMLGNGLQAVIIKPSALFSFLKLPIRTKILQMNLTPTTNKGKIEVVTEGKSGGARAKEHLKEFKHRTAMAALNKQLTTEARLILYAFRLRFDTTKALIQIRKHEKHQAAKSTERRGRGE